MAVIVSGRKTKAKSASRVESSAYIAVAPLEPLAAGKEFRKFPLHVTVVPWFSLKDEIGVVTVRELIEEELMPEHSMGNVLEGCERVMFGAEGDIPATRLSGFAFHLLGVHACMLGILNHVEAVFDTTYTGINYRPHVTGAEGCSVALREKVELRQLALVRKMKGSRVKVVDSVFNW